jgi:transposase
MQHTRFVGLDVHKDRISVAVAESGRAGTLEYMGEIANEPSAISRLCERLGRRGRPLSFCYEAGPCGYGIYRQLIDLGQRCDVVAPSLIPKKPGDRVKTNRRDATLLARLHRAGELTVVWVPDADHEAMRDLVRLRNVVQQIMMRARQHLQGFLLRHGRKHGHGRAWGLSYRRWLSTLAFAHGAQQIAFQDYVDAVTDAERRLKRAEEQIKSLLDCLIRLGKRFQDHSGCSMTGKNLARVRKDSDDVRISVCFVAFMAFEAGLDCATYD